MRGEFGYVRFIHDGAKDPKLQYICLLLICHFDTGGGGISLQFIRYLTVYTDFRSFTFARWKGRKRHLSSLTTFEGVDPVSLPLSVSLHRNFNRNRPRGASVLRYCKLVNRVRIRRENCVAIVIYISRHDDQRHRSRFAVFCPELSNFVDYREIT